MPKRQTAKTVNGNNNTNGQKTLIEDAYRKIKQLIYQQQLIPGQRLVYDDLAKMLEMSRTPIINALNRLEQQGLVVSESYRGFYVKLMDVQEAWDAFGIREALETYAVKQAIEHTTPADFAELEKKLIAHEAYTPNYYDRKKIFLDAQFHLQIAQMTGNRILKWHLKTNMEHVYLRADLSNYDMQRMAISPQQHRELVTRMKNKDTIGSIEIIRKHIQEGRDCTIACLSKKQIENEEYDL